MHELMSILKYSHHLYTCPFSMLLCLRYLLYVHVSPVFPLSKNSARSSKYGSHLPQRKVQLLSKIIDEKYPPDEDKGEEEYDDDGDRLMEEESEEEEVDEETDEFSEDDDNCDVSNIQCCIVVVFMH